MHLRATHGIEHERYDASHEIEFRINWDTEMD
jgi:hypothetical protein